MCLLLLAFISSSLAASAVRDVSDRFDQSLERMLKELTERAEETVTIGTFPTGEYWISSALMGNMSTFLRTSKPSLIEVGGRLSVEGGLTLGEMVIEGKVALNNGGRILKPRIVVRENFWNYNFWMDHNYQSCNSGVVVLPVDLGNMAMVSGNGRLGDEQDVTYQVKHHMTDAVRQRITGAISNVFKKHFDFCNLLKS